MRWGFNYWGEVTSDPNDVHDGAALPRPDGVHVGAGERVMYAVKSGVWEKHTIADDNSERREPIMVHDVPGPIRRHVRGDG